MLVVGSVVAVQYIDFVLGRLVIDSTAAAAAAFEDVTTVETRRTPLMMTMTTTCPRVHELARRPHILLPAHNACYFETFHQ